MSRAAVADLAKYQTNQLADLVQIKKEEELQRAITREDRAKVASAFEAFATARTQDRAAEAVFNKLSKPRRITARETYDFANQYAAEIARSGGTYSGNTRYAIGLGEACKAGSDIKQGARYAGTHWSTKDVKHIVTMSLEAAVVLYGLPRLRELSSYDGLPVLDYNPKTGAAIWAQVRGKQLTNQHGFIAFDEDQCYHSTKSLEHAQKGLTHAKHLREASKKRSAQQTKAARRARLIVRLCHGVTATKKDALAEGYCDVGITAFQQAHNIGDHATLPQLVATGNGAALLLALNVARKLKIKK